MKLYRARVTHRRMFPVRYRFAYSVFSLLLDLDRIEEQAGTLRLFSHNRFNLTSFHDRDHGPRDGSALRAWIDRLLAREAAIDLEGGRVRLLCFPRVLGFGFNPLSLWYCEHRDGRPRAVLCEVHNTFGEAHCYLLHADGAPLSWPIDGRKSKCFHVSPFIALGGDYAFRVDAPQERARAVVRLSQHGRALLTAVYDGRAEPVSDCALLVAAIAVPLMTLKVVAAIHWQALLIWLRGAPFFSKPTPPSHGVS